MNIEKKIYLGWAFTENEREKAKSNREIHQELKNKYKVFRSDIYLNPDVNLEDYDVVIGREACYLHAKYLILKNKPNLNDYELLLLCDSGNLCFGARKLDENMYRVNED